MTSIQVRETGTGTILPTEEGYYEEAGQEVTRGPQASFKVGDFDGSLQSVITPGVICEVYEGPDRKFVGIVERRKRTRGVDGFFLEATLRDLGYHYLRATPCDPYTYSETGAPDTDRDAVKVNPWEWRIFRSPFGNVLDIDGNPVAVEGVPLNDAFLGLCGSRFLFTHRFEDDRLFRVSDLKGLPGSEVHTVADKFDVMVDGKPLEIPSLQRVQGPLGYITNADLLRTVPLESGDPNVTPMGNITNLTIVLVGQPDSGLNGPVVYATRNARAGSPTYEAITLTRNANWNGSGLTAWTGLLTFAAGAGGSLGLKLGIAGASTSETTRIYYLKAACDLQTLDTGLGGASASTYIDPNGGTLDKLWVDDDFEGMSRAAALERLRTTTVTDPAVSREPHWTIYCDQNQIAYFKQRRGTDLDASTNTFSLDDDSLTVLKHEEFSEELTYQVICEGGGTGISQFTITDKVDFNSGGLYSAARDPHSMSPLYGALPESRIFRDQGTTSRSELRRRGRAYMRDRLDPQDYFEVTFITTNPRTFKTGDSIVVTDATLTLNKRVQVSGLKVRWSGTQGHAWDVALGHALTNPTTMMSGANAKLSFAQKSAILAAANKGVGGPGTYCDALHYGRASFVIPEQVDVQRCLLTVRTLPWQIYSRDSVSGETGISGGNLGLPPASFGLTQSLTVTSSRSDWTDFGGGLGPAPASTGLLDYAEILAYMYNDDETQERLSSEWRIIRTNGPDSGQVIALTAYVSEFSTTNPSSFLFGDQNTIGQIYRVTLVAQGSSVPIATGDTFKLQVRTIGFAGTNFTNDFTAFLSFVYQHAHTVPLRFGIWQFDGDDGTGDGAALYGVVRFAIDPTINAGGDPTNFTLEQRPDQVGAVGAPISRTFDVTNFLRRDASGRVAPGEHEVIFLGVVATDNAQGLAACAISTRLIAAEANG